MSMLLAASLAVVAPPVEPPTCAAQTIVVDGLPLWVDVQGHGAITVVFESGNGNDSTVWDALEPEVRAMGVQTFRYDRRGYGRSAHSVSSVYRVEMDLETLQWALASCKINGPIIMVAHSYGGGLAILTARHDQRVKGLVLVDAVAPGTETRQKVRDTLAEVRPQYAEVREKAPDLARTVIPIMEASPRTVRKINTKPVSQTMPIVDIVADGGGGQTKLAMTQQWRAAHRRFVAQAPMLRSYVDAENSSHKVMRDRPDLIIAAIRLLIGRLSSR